MQLERGFVDPHGLPDRPEFKYRRYLETPISRCKLMTFILPVTSCLLLVQWTNIQVILSLD